MAAHQPADISSRFTLKCYPSGHTTQTDPVAGPMLFKDTRDWIVATVVAK